MADQVLTLSVKVNAETGQLEVVGKQLGGIATESKKAERGFSDLSKSIGGLVTAGALAAFFKSAVQGAEEENQALRRLKFAVEASGKSFENAQGQIQTWAQGVQQATRFTDGQAIETMGRFVRVTGDLTQAQKASQLAMSLSVATGKDLGTSTEILTNLINKNERGVAMARKEFGALIAGAENGQQILDILAEKFGDAATKEEGFSKETASLSNNWDEFKDNIGNAVIPLLTKLTSWLNTGVNGLRAVGDAVAANAAIIFTTVEGVASAIKAILHRDFGIIDNIARDTWEKIKNITVETGESIRGEFEKTTQAHAVHADTRVQVTTRQTEAELAEFKKLNDERERDLARAAAMAEQLEMQILSVTQNTYAEKQALLDAETVANRRKIESEIRDTQRKEGLLAQLDKLHLKRTQELQKAEVIIKRDAAFKVVEDALQTLSIINNMQSGHTKAQVTRARVILALEKAIAIARLWAAEAGKGVVGVALASAGTALIAAQFAQQSKAIGDAAKIADQGDKEFSISSPGPNGETWTETVKSGDGSTTQSGGVVDTRTGGWAAGGGGGGAGTVINVGPTTVHFSADSVDVNNIDMIARRIGDAVSRGNVEAAQMALALYRSGQKQEGLAR